MTEYRRLATINANEFRSKFELIKELKKYYKEEYQNDERIVVNINETFNNSIYGDHLSMLQLALNDIDISNFFILVNSNDNNIKEHVKWVTDNLSYDTVSVQISETNNDRYQATRSQLKTRYPQLNIPTESFCVLPWISLEAGPIGTVRPCCLTDDEIKDEYDQPYTLTENSLSEIHNSEWMQILRSEFLQGKKPTTCRKCWDTEAAGIKSKRQHMQDRLKEILATEIKWTEDAKSLMFLDLKLGNICNLKCRICGSWSSSTFATEELEQVKSKKDSWHYVMLSQGRWPRTSPHFWEDLYKMSSDLRYIEFTGGEPFMIKEHFAYLQYLVDQGFAQNIEIHYNTNGTQWPEEHIHLWKHFKLVEIAFSIDNIGIRFEYERTNATWPEVVYNLKHFFELRNKNKNIQLQLCTTINIYNVLYLESICHWEFFDKFDFVYWNMLHNSPENCIQALPPSVKSAVAATLRRAKVDEKTRQEFDKVIEFMNRSNGVFPKAVTDRIDELDERRDHSLRSTHPELYRLLYEEAN
jgi:MoaA/NifB/PqqE/SkfB family radical SAM enzyme